MSQPLPPARFSATANGCQPKIAGTPVFNPSTGDVIAECPADTAGAALRRDSSQQPFLMKIADIPQLRDLPVAEKLLLVEELRSEITAKSDSLPLPAWHVRELDQSLAEYNANPREGSPLAGTATRFSPVSEPASKKPTLPCHSEPCEESIRTIAP